ncbi:site-2 protease family protein [Cellulomonas shaoxiangyii]|uniref:Peptidase M50 n=1 Tax=Cellulomonas shaoxiangyii TaxID=2566013 RepID=A0A4P7SLJ9_9CELL|nr:site-2 protease family protein [Cellulomonas shaoxiangyii]QCB93453.1 peptidase M50 [Cellulomonas shaoxiangyii]TGY84570.1 peptidase M50 [Cellulomonas shaoxiangyii]
MSTPRPARPSGWVLGHVAGAPVVLAPSWLLAVLVLTLLFAPSVQASTGLPPAATYAVAGVFVVLLFGSVLVHELAHGLVARARGQQPHAFVLTLMGGHTTFGGLAPTPATAALVAAVGPVANLVLAGGFLLAANAATTGSVLEVLLWAGAAANGFVGAFNLVPGLPLDGGRILEAAVWALTRDRHRGAVVAGWTGRLVAVGVLVVALAVPFLEGRPPSLVTVAWSALLGAFLWSGASAAVRGGRTGRAVDALTLGAVGRPAVAVPATASLADARAAAREAGVEEVVVTAPDGRPAAYVDREAAGRVPDALAGTTTVAAVATPLPVGALVDGTLAGEPLLAALGAATAHAPVVAAVVDGRVVALVRTVDVLAALRV